MKISSLTLANGSQIPVSKLTVIVGPNNVGKSRLLQDINLSMQTGSYQNNILIKNLTFESIKTIDDLLQGVTCQSHPVHADEILCKGLNSDLNSSGETSINKYLVKDSLPTDMNRVLRSIGRLKVAYLPTGARLNVATTKESISPDKSPNNLVQAYNLASKKIKEQFEFVFEQAFGMEITFDTTNYENFRFRVKKEFPVIPDDTDAFTILNEVPLLDEQGDGFVSFAGVILSVLLSADRIVLLDEPEAFLHPTQARVLGRWMSEHSQQQSGQIFVATHNANFLAGLLSTNAEVGIYRLDRQEENTFISNVPNDAILNLSRAPLLSSQPVLESIFYKAVVVCEADADRCLYQSVALKEYSNQDFLFIHAHEKYSIKKVVALLRKVGVPVSTIIDLDIINSKKELENLISSFGVNANPELIEIQQNLFMAIQGSDEDYILNDLKTKIQDFQNQLSRNEHTLAGTKGALERIQRACSKWERIKKNGIFGFPNDVQTNAQILIDKLKKIGIFLVPVGELESWIDGPPEKSKWIVKALEQIGEQGTPENLKKFMSEVLTHHV